MLFLSGNARAQCDELYDWATWSNFTGNSATGTIFTGGQNIDVTMTANYTFDFTNTIYNYAAFNGFSGPLPPNATVPRTTWASGPGGETTMCFSEPVTNPALLIASLGSPSIIVTLDFSHPYVLIYDGGGMTYPNDMSVIGQEGYCIIIFPGNLECVTIYSSTPEFYTNITWGLNPPLFEVNLEGDTVACESTVITASGGVSYSWDGGQDPDSPSNTFTESGTYFLTVTDDDGCTVITSVTVEIFPAVESILDTAICEGDFYSFHGQNLSVAGQYQAVLQTYQGCDSTLFLNLDVHPVNETELVEAICEGQSFFFNGNSYSQTGTYTAYLKNQFDCDSTVQLHLTVFNSSYTEIDLELCEGQTVDFNGQTLGATGSYYAWLLNQQGCDSTVFLSLVVNPISVTEIQAEICTGEQYVFEGDSLTDAGVYYATLLNQQGCDSTVVLRLEKYASHSQDFQVEICASETYVFNGMDLSVSGQYTDVLSNQHGCDSLLNLTLTVNPADTSILAVQLCDGQSYNFQGDELNVPGSYWAVLPSSKGCDSTIHLALDIVSAIETDIHVVICEGATYPFGGVELALEGFYRDTLSSAGGCDSIVNLVLSVLPLPNESLDVQICDGEGYFFDGITITAPGSYEATYQSAAGCDSLVTLHLAVVVSIEQTIQAQICAGSFYPFGGEDLMLTGVYSDTLSSYGGCDSIVTLSLAVHEGIQQFEEAVICEGADYFFDGDFLTASGEYVSLSTGFNGCDSTTTLLLTVEATFDMTEQVTRCDSIFSWHVTDETYTENGMYEVVNYNQQGCDSVHRLMLTLLPSWYHRDTVQADRQFVWTVNNTTYTQSGIYAYPLQTASGCDSVFFLHLTLNPTSRVYVPSAFSPNYDGINDRFTIYGDKTLELIESMLIFDRWGNLLAEYRDFPPNDPQYGWDGTGMGKVMDPGVYVYMAMLRFVGDTTAVYSGDVSLTK